VHRALHQCRRQYCGAESADGKSSQENCSEPLWSSEKRLAPVQIHKATSRARQDHDQRNRTESPQIIEVERPIYARATSGTVVDPSGSGITKALVEIVTENRKTRLAATFTNDEGAFSFPHAVAGKHYLKVSMPIRC
jgi:hypothetical protein